MSSLVFMVSFVFGPVGVPASDVPQGTWYLNADNARRTLTLRTNDGGRSLQGTLLDESVPDKTEPVDSVEWDAKSRRLGFRAGGHRYLGTIAEGVLVGRFGPKDQDGPATLTKHVTGWNADVLAAEGGAHVYELIVNGRYRARLRLDSPCADEASCAGRLKVYASIQGGARDEEDEHDLEVTRWDGTNLRFVRRGRGWTQDYTGVVSGRTIRGMFTHSGREGVFPWEGTRAEVLGYGFRPKSPEDRAAWQERTRRRFEHLMMADNPKPLSRKVVELSDASGSTDLPPLKSKKPLPHRDDDPERWPQDYRLRELRFEFTLPNPYGEEPLTRTAHGFLAVPNAVPAGGKFPAVLAVNGHGGSAWQQMDPDSDPFWYGDAFARRGYVVLALDISHRPVEDRKGLYGGSERGDDPRHGNGPHPAIKAPGFDSDWEEDGERVWDAMRAADYLLSLSNVDPRRALVTGLSMGGEVTAFTAALDTRFALSIPSGYSPDLGVMTHYGNHECWRWNHADIREYLDISDTFALTAPRALIIQTGKADRIFSALKAPFAADKQVARRVRAAYGGQTHRFLHYLHYDRHHYHVGDRNSVTKTERGIRVPALIEPDSAWSPSWQSDDRTTDEGLTLFDYSAFFLDAVAGQP